MVFIFASDLKSFGTRSSFSNTQSASKNINSWILPLAFVYWVLHSIDIKYSFEYIIENYDRTDQKPTKTMAIVNSSNILAVTMYVAYTLQVIRCPRACSQIQ